MTMNQQQPLEESELCNGIIRRVDSLETLFTRNADANVSRLDHANIIGTISDGECHDAKTILDEPDNQGLLQW